MQKLRTERGITLIALIITIIVMLILVGVTVSVSLNGGLFTTAKQATGRTQVEIDKEQLLELALGAMNDKGKVVIADLDTAVAADERFTGTGGTYTSVKSGKTYTVNNWGSVTEAPAYKLSGRWEFIDSLTPANGESEGVYVSQNISFSSSGRNYSSITVEHVEYNEETYYLCVNYDNENVFHGMTFGWVDNVDSTQYRTIDFGATPQTVSKEFYEWFTANANQVETPEYELSGEWRFVDTPQPQTTLDGWNLTQEIAFTAEGYAYNDEGTDSDFNYAGTVSYGTIKVSYDSTLSYPFVIGYFESDPDASYENSIVYGGGNWCPEPRTDIPDYQNIDFGSAPQPVSQEFYEWFTANANPVQE